MEKIIIRGKRLSKPLERLQHIEDSNIISDLKTFEITSLRSSQDKEEITISEIENYCCEVEFEDGGTWIGDLEELPNILGDEQGKIIQNFTIPEYVERSTGRGLFEKVKVKFLSYFFKKFIEGNIEDIVRDAAGAIDKKIVSEPGLYRVNHKFDKIPVPSNELDLNLKYLLLIPGTIANLNRTFQGFYDNVSLWEDLWSHYDGNILVLEHHTLTKSPIENVIDFFKSIPASLHFDIISGSRGGLIGDILCRLNENNQVMGFQEEEIIYLKNEGADKYAQDIEILMNESSFKRIYIDKFIRVACPANGTLIASKNLDYFFNILNNLIKAVTGGSLIASSIGNAVLKIIGTKSNVNILPGVAAMVPNNPFIFVLNNIKYKTNDQLSIVYSNANIKGGLLKSIAFILFRAIFLRDNDFVVNTDSMFWGARRNKIKRGLAIKNNNIHHLCYFKDDSLQKTLLLELKEDYAQSNFTNVVSYNDSTRGIGIIPGGKLYFEETDEDKDVIIVLPGILGSILSEVKNKKENPIWIDYAELMTNGLDKLKMNSQIKATHIEKSSYYRICNELVDSGFDVYTFPYDWRKSVKDAADKLVVKIEKLLSKKRRLKIVAHSMGGLVIKELMRRETYQKLQEQENFKLIFLGTPWHGSMLIPQLLVGQGNRFNTLNKLTFCQNGKDLLKIISTFRGLFDLLPYYDEYKKEMLNFFDFQSWQKIKDITNDESWSLPNKEVLTEAWNYAKEVNNHSFVFRNCYYIAGKDDSTANTLYSKPNEKTWFTGTPKGDGAVTWQQGIPKGLKNVYYVDEKHGKLASSKKLLPGLLDILFKGRTTEFEFSRNPPITISTRGNQKILIQTSLPNNEEELLPFLFGMEPKEVVKINPQLPELNITVVNTDLLKSSYPVMVGRFSFENLKGAEGAVNTILNGELDFFARSGLLSSRLNNSKVVYAKEKGFFKGALVIGMGDREKLTAYSLQQTIEKACLDYAIQKHAKENYEGNISKGDKLKLGLSTVMLGSITGNLSHTSCIDSIIRGVTAANEHLLDQNRNVFINHVEFVELYEDRANSLYLNLLNLEKNLNETNRVSIKKEIEKKDGWRLRLPEEYTDDQYDLLTVTSQPMNPNDKINGIRSIQFRSLTGYARDEVKPSFTSEHIIKSMNAQVINTRWNKKFSKALFELLVPLEFKNQFKRQGNILLSLDKETANYPWEMIVTDLRDSEPFSVKSSIVRKYQTSDYRENLNFVDENTAFIISNPDTKGVYDKLPHAAEEGLIVGRLLDKHDFEVIHLDKGNPKTIDYITTLLSGKFKILHIAAHGILENSNNGQIYSKIILGPDESDVLTSFDLSKLSYTPDLAFVNCCYIGTIKNDEGNESYQNLDETKKEVVHSTFRDRYKLAASIAETLLEGGYKAVVVAGWAVGDQAAKVFAEEFYRNLLNNETFGQSVRKAREKCYREYPDENTWGAYQCYGDPSYRLELKKSENGVEGNFRIMAEVHTTFNKFLNPIRMRRKDKAVLKAELNALTNTLEESKFKNDPKILEMEADCYAELGLFDEAISKYDNLIKSGYSSMSVRVFEQIISSKVRQITNTKHQNVNEKITKINNMISLLDNLISYGGSIKRLSIKGSAFIKLYQTEWKKSYLSKALETYAKAVNYKIEENELQSFYYPLLNYVKIHYLLQQTSLPTEFENLFGTKALSNINSIRLRIYEYLTNKSSSIKARRFWDEMLQVSIVQYHILITTSLEELPEIQIKLNESFSRALNYGCTYRQLQSEIDHVHFLIEALNKCFSYPKKDGEKLTTKLKASYKELNDEKCRILKTFKSKLENEI